MTKKMLLLGTALTFIVGTIIYKNNMMAWDWGTIDPSKNPTGYGEAFGNIMDQGKNIGRPGNQVIITCTIKNQNTYMDIDAYTVEYEPVSQGPLSEAPSKWTGDMINYNGQAEKQLISSSCFKMPVHMTIGGSIKGHVIWAKDRAYGTEITKCQVKNVTITLKGSSPEYGNEEPGVLIELGSASNKLFDYDEYFYDILGPLKWHKKNGQLQ